MSPLPLNARMRQSVPLAVASPGTAGGLSRFARRSAWALAAVSAWAMALPAAAADIGSIVQFRNVMFVQDAVIVASAGAFFTTELVAEPGFGDGLFQPGLPSGLGNIYALQADGNGLSHSMSSAVYGSKQAMDADFAPGMPYTYAVSPLASPGVNVAEVVIQVPADTYPDQIPHLTGQSYQQLQGHDASLSVSLSFNSFQPDAAASEAYVFFSVFDRATYQRVFDLGFAPPSQGGVTLPGGTLLPGHDYFYELIFDNRVLAPVLAGDTTFENRSNYELRTSGLFSTSAVPEPGAALMLVVGLAGLALARRKARATAA